MNKKIILLFIAIAILFVLGGIFCLKKNTQTSPIQSNKAILWDCDSNDKILLSEMADTFSLLPLETIDRSLMGEISKLVFSGDSFYVLDRNYMSAIFSFNTQTGKFIEKNRGNREWPRRIQSNLWLLNRWKKSSHLRVGE